LDYFSDIGFEDALPQTGFGVAAAKTTQSLQGLFGDEDITSTLNRFTESAKSGALDGEIVNSDTDIGDGGTSIPTAGSSTSPVAPTSFASSTRTTGLFMLPILVPPLVVAEYDPNIFLNALDAAGLYGISFLYGVLPPMLAYRLRNEAAADPDYQVFVPGGSASLAVVVAAVAFIVFEKLT
jgi:hypothetical protein